MTSELPSFVPGAFEYTQSPNPSFKFGQKVDATTEGKKWREGEKEGWKVVETDKEDPKFVPSAELFIVSKPPTNSPLCLGNW